MDNKMILYHGSEKIIENPIFGAGKKNNVLGWDFIVQKVMIWQKNGQYHL